MLPQAFVEGKETRMAVIAGIRAIYADIGRQVSVGPYHQCC